MPEEVCIILNNLKSINSYKFGDLFTQFMDKHGSKWFTIVGILIFVIGVKLFPDKNSKIPFKKVLIGVGYAHAPGLIRFFAVTPDLVLPVIFLTQFWIFASLIISTKHVLGLKSNFKSFGIIFLAFLLIAFLSISFVISRMNALPISTIS